MKLNQCFVDRVLFISTNYLIFVYWIKFEPIMRRKGLTILYLMGVLFLGCSKSNVKATPAQEQTPTGPKTAPDNYAKTYTDGASLFALWKPISGYTSIYNQYGVLLGVDKLPVAALSQIQFLDATHFKETNYLGIITPGSYNLNATDTTRYINFLSDEGYNTYGIDTLVSKELAVSQIIKYTGGTLYSLNGTNYYVFEVVTHFNFNQ